VGGLAAWAGGPRNELGVERRLLAEGAAPAGRSRGTTSAPSTTFSPVASATRRPTRRSATCPGRPLAPHTNHLPYNELGGLVRQAQPRGPRSPPGQPGRGPRPQPQHHPGPPPARAQPLGPRGLAPRRWRAQICGHNCSQLSALRGPYPGPSPARRGGGRRRGASRAHRRARHQPARGGSLSGAPRGVGRQVRRRRRPHVRPTWCAPTATSTEASGEEGGLDGGGSVGDVLESRGAVPAEVPADQGTDVVAGRGALVIRDGVVQIRAAGCRVQVARNGPTWLASRPTGATARSWRLMRACRRILCSSTGDDRLLRRATPWTRGAGSLSEAELSPPESSPGKPTNQLDETPAAVPEDRAAERLTIVQAR